MKQTGKVIVSIDTSDQDTAKVSFEVDSKRYEKISESRVMKAQMVLPLVETLLQEHGLTTADIAQIRVHTGPGSFTGLRVGAAIALALSTLLQVPVNGNPPGTPIDLHYSNTP